MPRLPLLLLALLLASWFPASSPAQLLQGEWVVRSQTRIHELRKGNVRIILLGRDRKPVPAAEVRITQLRHDFPLGFVVHDPAEVELLDETFGGPVLRVFNTIALDALSAWPQTQPQPNQSHSADLTRALDAAVARRLAVRFGGVLSADPGLLPDWAASLPPDRLRAAAVTRVRDAAALYPRVQSFDLYTHVLSSGGTTQKLGRAGLRQLFHRARVEAPDAQISIRIEDALVEQRIPDMLQRLRAMREAFIPFNAVTLEQRIGGILPQAPVDRAFRLLDSLDLPLTLVLEVGGASESSAAVNLETFLRVAFASAPVQGIVFAGLHETDVADPAASLLTEDHQPTEPGQMLDDLFRKLWWTDDAFVADELGNVTARVFAGNHRITATLPDGTKLETLVHVPKQALDDLPLIVLLEP